MDDRMMWAMMAMMGDDGQWALGNDGDDGQWAMGDDGR